MKHGRFLLAAWILRGRTTPAAAARELGLKRAQMWKYLHGYATPTLEKALHIQDHTGVPVESWRESRASGMKKRVSSGAKSANVSGHETGMAAS